MNKTESAVKDTMERLAPDLCNQIMAVPVAPMAQMDDIVRQPPLHTKPRLKRIFLLVLLVVIVVAIAFFAALWERRPAAIVSLDAQGGIQMVFSQKGRVVDMECIEDEQDRYDYLHLEGMTASEAIPTALQAMTLEGEFAGDDAVLLISCAYQKEDPESEARQNIEEGISAAQASLPPSVLVLRQEETLLPFDQLLRLSDDDDRSVGRWHLARALQQANPDIGSSMQWEFLSLSSLVSYAQQQGITLTDLLTVVQGDLSSFISDASTGSALSSDTANESTPQTSSQDADAPSLPQTPDTSSSPRPAMPSFGASSQNNAATTPDTTSSSDSAVIDASSSATPHFEHNGYHWGWDEQDDDDDFWEEHKAAEW